MLALTSGAVLAGMLSTGTSANAQAPDAAAPDAAAPSVAAASGCRSVTDRSLDAAIIQKPATWIPGADQAVDIHLGETLCLVGTREGDRIVDLRAVAEAPPGAEGVKLELSVSLRGSDERESTNLRVNALDGTRVAFQYATPFGGSDYLLGGRVGFIDDGRVVLPPSFMEASVSGKVPRAVVFDLRRGDAYEWPAPTDGLAPKKKKKNPFFAGVFLTSGYSLTSFGDLNPSLEEQGYSMSESTYPSLGFAFSVAGPVITAGFEMNWSLGGSYERLGDSRRFDLSASRTLGALGVTVLNSNGIWIAPTMRLGKSTVTLAVDPNNPGSPDGLVGRKAGPSG